MRTAVALVLATLVLVGPAAAEPAPKMAPKPAPKAAPEPSFNTPPDFPPDYRSKIARMMVKEYLREGKGRPQISEFRQNVKFADVGTARAHDFGSG